MLFWESLLGGAKEGPTSPLLFIWGSGEAGQLANMNGTTGVPNNLTLIRSWSQVSAGSDFVIARTSDNLLWTWGLNSFGQLGQGTTIANFSPTQIGNSSWTAVQGGFGAAYAIRQDGRLFAWGINTHGGLGLNNTLRVSSPTQIGTSSWSVLGMISNDNNQFSMIAIRQGGTLFTWGFNSSAQLGDGTIVNRSSPVQIGTSSWTAASMGERNGAALRQDGRLFTWGSQSGGKMGNYIAGVTPTVTTSWRMANLTPGTGAGIDTLGRLLTWGDNNVFGQLGLGNTIGQITSPTQVGTSSWTMVSIGIGAFMAAIRQDGRLFTWGENTAGQLGLDDRVSRSSPTQVGTSSWTFVTTGQSNVMAVRQDGVLFGWGSALTKAFPGVPTNENRSSPMIVDSGSWLSAALGYSNTYAIRQNGTLWTWGDNINGCLGLTNSNNQVLGIDQSWTMIASTPNADAYFGISKQGSLWSWGSDNQGIRGRSGSSAPAAIDSSNSWIAVNAGYLHAMAIRSNGTLWTWGYNNDGQLGLGDTTNRSSPTQVGSDSNWSTVVCGDYHSGALKSDGSIWMWGNGSDWKLGTGTNENRSSPCLVAPGRSFRSLSLGYVHTAAVRNDGILYQWGQPTYGVLGNFLSNINNSGEQSFIFSSWQGVDSNTIGDAAIGIIDGRLWVWGQNRSGMLGLGDSSGSIQFARPLAVDSSWTAVAMGRSSTSAIRSDGRLFVWGNNAFGQLGLGDLIDRSSPTQVGTSSWTSVRMSDQVTGAIRQGGTLFTWGNNDIGQLGLGNTTSRSSPTQLGTSSWSALSMGRSHTAAIRQGGSLFTWGYNDNGQLGDGTRTNRSSPVLLGSSSWTAVSVMGNNSGAIRQGGTLFTWGFNRSPSSLGLGFGDRADRSSPTQVGTSSWTLISMAGTGGMALRQDGRALSWGLNSDGFGFNQGRLGLGDNVNRDDPTRVTGGAQQVSYTYMRVGSPELSGATMLIAGPQSAFRNGIGTLWGCSNNFTLMDNRNEGASYPVFFGWSPQKGSIYIPVPWLFENSWTSVGAGYYMTGAVSADVNSTYWALGGWNYLGQLGISATEGIYRSEPSQSGTNNVQQLFISRTFTNSLIYNPSADSRQVAFWGNNSQGQVGLSPGSWPSVNFIYNGWSEIRDARSIAVNSQGFLISRFSPLTGTSPTVPMFYMGAGLLDPSYYGELVNYETRSSPGATSVMNSSSPNQIGSNTNWTKVEVGYFMVGARNSSNQLFTWGTNDVGQLGLGDLIQRSSPVQVGAISVADMSVNYNFTLARNSSNQLYAWGRGQNGQLGQNDFIDRSNPVQITKLGATAWTGLPRGSLENLSVTGAFQGPANSYIMATWGQGSVALNPLSSMGPNNTPVFIDAALVGSPVQIGSSSWTQVSMGSNWGSAIRQGGSLFVWGINESGRVQLGLGSSISEILGSPNIIGASSYTQVSTAGYSNIARKIDGTLVGWGTIGNQHGIPGQTGNRSSPVAVTTGSWTAITINGNSVLGIAPPNSWAYAWGSGVGTYGQGYNQITQGNINSPRLIFNNVAYSPQQVGILSWKQVSNLGKHTLAINSDNKLWVWGNNTVGQLGLGNTSLEIGSPTQLGTSNWNQVGTGWETSLAIRQDGTLWAWGMNQFGQIGDSTSTSRSSPVQIGTSSWSSLGNAWYDSFAIRQDGTLWAWGYNFRGVLGLGNVTSRNSPVQVGTSSWTQVSGSIYNVAAIRSDGALFTWGEGRHGELGDNLLTTRSSPVQLGNSSWISVSAGRSYVMGLVRNTAVNGTLFAWGTQVLGQIGNNTTGQRSYSNVSLGNGYQLFIENGLLYGTGINTNGQLGLGDLNSRSVPVQIGTSSWSQAFAGSGSSMAIRQDGTLWAWGANTTGQLGLGDLIQRSSPVQVGTSSWTLVAFGSMNSIPNAALLRVDGRLFIQGQNGSGQLGLGDIINRSSPTQVGTSSWVAVRGVDAGFMAIRQGGTLFSWGRGSQSALGLGDLIDRSSPTQVGTSSWTALGGTNVAAMAIRQGGTLFVWGLNSVGQLGLGDTTNRSSPTQLGTSSWVAVSTTRQETAYARLSDGVFYGWGLNTSQQLNPITETFTNRSSPVIISAPAGSWTFVTAGASTGSLGLLGTGQAYIWAAGWSFGSAGDNNSTGSYASNTGQVVPDTSPWQFVTVSPVQVGSQLWRRVSAGGLTAAAINNTNLLYTWGAPDNGQLGGPGSGSYVYRSSPVQVGTSSWTLVSGGFNNMVAFTK